MDGERERPYDTKRNLLIINVNFAVYYSPHVSFTLKQRVMIHNAPLCICMGRGGTGKWSETNFKSGSTQGKIHMKLDKI